MALKEDRKGINMSELCCYPYSQYQLLVEKYFLWKFDARRTSVVEWMEFTNNHVEWVITP